MAATYAAKMTAFAATLFACACGSDHNEPDAPAVAMLSIRICLSDDVAATRAGEEYDPDRLPADNGEKMQLVRVIIADSRGIVEHNSLTDYRHAPDVTVAGGDFPVTTADMKTVLLIANEHNAVLTLPDGSVCDASSYLGRFNASAGARLDMAAIRSLRLDAAHNSPGVAPGSLASPTVMTAFYNYYIGTDRERYSATFNIHRAAVKYTYRIANNDTRKSHTLDKIHVSNVAAAQYFFPDADYSDTEQKFFTAYRTPQQELAVSEIPVALTLPPGGSVEAGPFYYPEGPSGQNAAPYSTGFTYDGRFLGWEPLRWFIPQQPGQLYDMTDMPRNTHVIVNVSFSETDVSIRYTVCPWVVKTIDIPPFN